MDLSVEDHQVIVGEIRIGRNLDTIVGRQSPVIPRERSRRRSDSLQTQILRILAILGTYNLHIIQPDIITRFEDR